MIQAGGVLKRGRERPAPQPEDAIDESVFERADCQPLAAIVRPLRSAVTFLATPPIDQSSGLICAAS